MSTLPVQPSESPWKFKVYARNKIAMNSFIGPGFPSHPIYGDHAKPNFTDCVGVLIKIVENKPSHNNASVAKGT